MNHRTIESLLVVVAAALSVHCGGAVEPANAADTGVAPADTGDAADTNADSHLDAAGPCTFANGATICGDKCGGDFTSCGVCAEFKDVDGKKMSVGTCTVDAAKMMGARCPRCSPGYLCAQQEVDDTLVCVNPILCETQKTRGDSSRPCYWPDVTPWTGNVTIPGAACPAAGLDLCGGDCAACPTGTSCFGRSPRHPIGFCGRVFREDGGALGCRRGSFGCQAGEACFIFETDAPQQVLANEAGFCMPVDRCKSIRSLLPGGAFCTGEGGVDL